MILIILGLLILVYSFYDFKKAYYGYIVYTIFWASQALCFKVGGKDIIINMVMSLGLFISFLVNYKKINKTKKLMPFTVPFILIFISMVLTCFFAKAGLYSEITRVISSFLQRYTTIFISWYVFETKEDFIKLIKLIIVSFLIASVYGIIEFIIQKNIFVDYKRSISTDMLSPHVISTRGYRVISVFDNAIGAGLNFALVCAFILYLYIYRKGDIPIKRISMLTALLCFICAVLTKQRGSYLYLLIALIPCFNPNKVNLKKIILILVVVITISLPFVYNRLNIVTSVFSSEAQSQIKGSTLQMRIDQYEAIKTSNGSLLFGGGEKVLDYISPEMKDQIKGAESVWLEQFLKHGIIGVVIYIIFAVYSIIIIPIKYKSKLLLFFGLAYWITNSVTTILGFRFDLYYCILFYFIKTSTVYIESSN